MLSSFPKFISHDYYEAPDQASSKNTSHNHGASCSCGGCLGEARKAIKKSKAANFSSDGTELQNDYTLQDSVFLWKQPGGKGTPLTLTYSYTNLFDGGIKGGITNAEMKSAIQEAFKLWAKYAPLNFVEIEDKGTKSRTNPDGADIRIGHGNLGGRGGTLGRANLRYDGELATTVSFDNQDPWDTDRTRTAQDFLVVAVHEIGHVLGLKHEEIRSAIMRPTANDVYSGLGSSFLYSDDIEGIRAIFGSGSGRVTPRPVNNPGGTPTPTPPTPTPPIPTPPTPTPPTPTPPTDALKIVGTNGRDVLVGNNLAQTFYARGGDDVIKAGGGNDVVNAGRGNDRLFGGLGDDTLYGGSDNDVVEAGRGDDKLVGGFGDDTLYGDLGNDVIIAGRGDDELYGGLGDDRLVGGLDDDRLVGVSASQSKPGLNERDVLLGGGGADVFVLGDARTAYYNDGRSNTQGLSDYALVRGFSQTSGDKIQLHGSASDYSLGAAPSGTPTGKAIFLTTSGQDELIAIVKGNNNLNLQSSAFEFV